VYFLDVCYHRFIFEMEVSLYYPGWPGTCDSPASASLLGLQVCAAMPSLDFLNDYFSFVICSNELICVYRISVEFYYFENPHSFVCVTFYIEIF
jgi:hypothetical protein